LLDLLGRKGESGEQFYDYLHQNICQNWRRRDPGINAESAEEVLEGRKQINKRVVARINVFDRLGTSMSRRYGDEIEEGDIRQVGRRCQRILLSQAGMAVEG
jgi:hypothetical protein